MRLFNLAILLFVLTAFAVGTATKDVNPEVTDNALHNASLIINNITLTKNSSEVYTSGIITIIEKFVHFAGTLLVEITRLGVHFGQNNPEYFTPEYVLGIIKFIIFLYIASLLIQPLFYLIVFLIMLGIWIKDKIKFRKERKAKK